MEHIIAFYNIIIIMPSSPTTPQSLPHEYPQQPAYQLDSADTQDKNDQIRHINIISF